MSETGLLAVADGKGFKTRYSAVSSPGRVYEPSGFLKVEMSYFVDPIKDLVKAAASLALSILVLCLLFLYFIFTCLSKQKGSNQFTGQRAVVEPCLS